MTLSRARRWVPILAAAVLALPSAAASSGAGAPAAPPAGTAGPAAAPSVAGGAKSAPAAGAKGARAADSRQENRLLARRYLTEVLAAGKLDKLDEIVARTFVDRSPAASNARGLEAARQAAQRVRKVFATVEYDPQEVTAEDDRVAVHYTVVGAPRPLPGKPSPPTVALDGVAFFHMHAGRIDSAFVLNDQAGFLRQLGFTMVPAPGTAPPARGSQQPAAAAPPGAAARPPATEPGTGAPGASNPPPHATPPPAAAAPSPAPSGSPPPAIPPPGFTEGSLSPVGAGAPRPAGRAGSGPKR